MAVTFVGGSVGAEGWRKYSLKIIAALERDLFGLVGCMVGFVIGRYFPALHTQVYCLLPNVLRYSVLC